MWVIQCTAVPAKLRCINTSSVATYCAVTGLNKSIRRRRCINSMKGRFRFSLMSVFLFTALIALSLSHVRTSLRFHSSVNELEWLRNRLNQSWPDPQFVNAISLDVHSTGWEPHQKRAKWHWRIMLPPETKYRIRWEASKSLGDFPTRNENTTVLSGRSIGWKARCRHPSVVGTGRDQHADNGTKR